MVNSYFEKKEDHLVTFKSGSIKTQIDYFFTTANSPILCNDHNVIPSEYLGSWIWSSNVQSEQEES